MDDEQETAGFEFFSNFDSANLSKIEYVPPKPFVRVPNYGGKTPPPELPDVEFNIWTKPDASGTEFENGYRTWFYFGIRANAPGLLVKLNMVDLNRQAKMFSQGMAPVCKILPGKPNWERVRDKCTYTVNDNIFTLSFKYRTPENIQSIVYFAFTYPYSYTDLTSMLGNIDNKFVNAEIDSKDDIYYVREAVCFTLEGRRVELITITSHHKICTEREARLKNLFPEQNVPRPFRFTGKKVIFVSARVHPGETPSSFVFNGFLNLLLNREDPVAIVLRRLYVFKLIPMLNPDGVARGHYRTDTRGINLNRVYLNPSIILHPSIYAARALLRYYHYGYEKEDEMYDNTEFEAGDDTEDGSSVEDNRQGLSKMTLEENNGNAWCCKCKGDLQKLEDSIPGISELIPEYRVTYPHLTGKAMCANCQKKIGSELDAKKEDNNRQGDTNENESGLFLYMDMHGHASKKGIFMYGNHFEDLEKSVECMLLAKLMSINNYNFHFTACNFTERNMYITDRRDGMSKEGSGRVAVLKLTGLLRSYTLECNYNTGRIVNTLPSTIKESNPKATHNINAPPKYTPQTFEEVGKALGASILDLTSQNPLTRLPHSPFHSLNGLRDWLRIHCMNEFGESGFNPQKFNKPRISSNLYTTQGKAASRSIAIKTRSATTKGSKRMSAKTLRSSSVHIERKENIFETGDNLDRPSCSGVSARPSRPKVFGPCRPKPRRDSALRLKHAVEKSKSSALQSSQNATTGQIVSKQKGSLVHKKAASKETRGAQAKGETSGTSRAKLQEICYLKDNDGGKRIVAKFKKEEELIITWNVQNDGQVVTHKQSKDELSDLVGGDASTSSASKSGGTRAPSYAKSSTSAKLKRTKRPLRRLTSTADTPTKIDKLKKRKIAKNQ